MTRVEPTAIAGVVLIAGATFADERGEFRKVVTVSESSMDPHIEQVATASNKLAGTVRGMHFQTSPHDEAKTLWCLSGAAYDVLVDARPEQPTYGQWASIRLDSSEPLAVHVPPGVAHGYQTLVDGTALAYLISSRYAPDRQQTLAFDDPTVGIVWPLAVSCVSASDRAGSPWPPQP